MSWRDAKGCVKTNRGIRVDDPHTVRPEYPNSTLSSERDEPLLNPRTITTELAKTSADDNRVGCPERREILE